MFLGRELHKLSCFEIIRNMSIGLNTPKFDFDPTLTCVEVVQSIRNGSGTEIDQV